MADFNLDGAAMQAILADTVGQKVMANIPSGREHLFDDMASALNNTQQKSAPDKGFSR